MPGLRDLLKKKDKIAGEAQDHQQPDRAGAGAGGATLAAPEFTFIRSTTESEEIIQLPTYPDDDDSTDRPRNSKEKKRLLGFRHSSNSHLTKDHTATLSAAAKKSSQQLPVRTKGERRLSDRFGLHRRDRSRSGSVESSKNLPQDLPEAPAAVAARPKSQLVRGSSYNEGAEEAPEDKAAQEEQEAKWEKRATILAMKSPLREGQIETGNTNKEGRRRSHSRGSRISKSEGDVNIQEAIRLHEAGDLKWSTEMFGALASPKGQNNALAQVLYGLALRHGWGVPIEPDKAIHYLQLAAANSASIEEQALASGMKKGGAAKGELVLAIFELANCFRHGWGVKKDDVAARQYYETAANLGDTDAMDEAAWCYLEGFGGAKDKFKAAQYLRLAEEKGSKGVGNSWIWKDKYNPK